MDRTDHRLEGWDGYEVQEYRLSPTSDEWRDVRKLSRMDAAHRAAVMAVLNLDAENLMRMRRMSRRERWNAGQDGLERLGMCRKLYEASWADPHSIKVAMGQQQAQIAELMSATRAEGEMPGVKRLAAEKMNAALIDAAKEANAKPATYGGPRATIEELTCDSTVPAAPSPRGAETETDDPIDFLNRDLPTLKVNVR